MRNGGYADSGQRPRHPPQQMTHGCFMRTLPPAVTDRLAAQAVSSLRRRSGVDRLDDNAPRLPGTMSHFPPAHRASLISSPRVSNSVPALYMATRFIRRVAMPPEHGFKSAATSAIQQSSSRRPEKRCICANPAWHHGCIYGPYPRPIQENSRHLHRVCVFAASLDREGREGDFGCVQIAWAAFGADMDETEGPGSSFSKSRNGEIGARGLAEQASV